ncbi:MAG: hypothetical protein PHO89_08800, partial [Methylacidiphilaceae bacterium]|nr:hypothetical protein [Candidatus Methylacidiphilaceae bacterium]
MATRYVFPRGSDPISRKRRSLVASLLLLWIASLLPATAAEASAGSDSSGTAGGSGQNSQVAELIKRLEDQGIPVQANTK